MQHEGGVYWEWAQMRGDVILVDGQKLQRDGRCPGKWSRLSAEHCVRKQALKGILANTRWSQVCRKQQISHHFVGGITEHIVDLSVSSP